MKKVILGLIIFGLTTQIFAQNTAVEELPTVVLNNVNYKYLSDVNNDNEAMIVEFLQSEVANFDLKSLPIYEDEESKYEVYFAIRDAHINVIFNSKGEITQSSEKFKNSKLPPSVSVALINKYPGWNVSQNTYLITYNQEKGTTKTYKFILENGDHRIRLKTDGDGNIL